MSKIIQKSIDGSYETEQTSIKFHFLDCNCQCCGEKQQYIPNKNIHSYQQLYSQMLKTLIKPYYALDCTCQCGKDLKQLTGFSTDTGIRRFNQSDEGKTM